MVKIRLKRMGSKFNAFYRIIVADARAPRDGKFIENIGFYNPHSKELFINLVAKEKWMSHGAVPTNVVKKLITKYQKISANKDLQNTKLIVTLESKKNHKKEDINS